MKPENIVSVEKSLGYTFRDKSFLIRALTRKAFALEQKQQGRSCEDQEVYRILGDAVLKAILVEMLIEKGYDSREAITIKKIELEKRENLGAMLQEMKLAPFIRFGTGEQKQGISRQSSVLGETFEALIAAIHIDAQSYENTKSFVIKLFNKQVPNNSSIRAMPQQPAKNLDIDVMDKLWMYGNLCSTCFQPEICAAVGICYFDLSDGD